MKDEYVDKEIPFGKHKGEMICEVEDSYLEWLLDQDWFCLKFPIHKKLIDKELKYRKDFNIPI